MTYEQRRLRLGISCVGTVVVLSTIALLTGWPASLLPAETVSIALELQAVLLTLFGLCAVMLPFDVLGGYVLPTLHARYSFRGEHLLRYLTGLLLTITIATISILLYRRLGTLFGAGAVVLAFVALQTILLATQSSVVRALGIRDQIAQRAEIQNPEDGARQPTFVEGSSSAFTGGVVGFPGYEKLMIPAAWVTKLKPETLTFEISRRRHAISSGSRWRGVTLAIFWNTVSFACAIHLPGAGVDSISDLFTSYCYFTIISFAGLLALPGLNRLGVLEVDQLAARRRGQHAAREALIEMAPVIDAESERSAQLESVFHPIPCLQRRLDELERPEEKPAGAWNVARMSLFLAWAFGGPLSRAVHCNVGIPELWALPPTD